VERLYPDVQTLQPPYQVAKRVPHLLSAAPYREHSFRIKEDWFSFHQGPTHDIIQLLSLATRRGSCTDYPEYRIDAFQHTAGHYALSPNSLGPANS
jgi:hypothetical protein